MTPSSISNHDLLLYLDVMARPPSLCPVASTSILIASMIAALVAEHTTGTEAGEQSSCCCNEGLIWTSRLLSI